MSCKIEKSTLSGKIVCPTNKSYTHRVVFLATLPQGESTITNVLRSADTNATISACKSFGADIKGEESTLHLKSADTLRPAKIDAKNSGTTIRIASAIAALVDGTSTLTGDDSLKKRPMQPLLEALGKIGAKCSSNDGKPPVVITGKISGGEITIPGNISSQFISALMIAAPRIQDGITLNIEGDLVSKPYLEATIAVMKKFGVKIQTMIPFKRYAISPQIYKAITFTVPSDFSSLALLLSASVLVGKDLQIKVAFGDLPQGDESFIDILESMGVKISIDGDVVTVHAPEKLTGGRFDLSNTPDLLPPLAILALKCSHPLEIFNVRHARFKETDRITILARELVKVGIKVKENEDGLVLESPDMLKGAQLNSENDHRLFMAFSIVGMTVGNCTVSDPDSVLVSYPNFVDEVNRAGGKISSSA